MSSEQNNVESSKQPKDFSVDCSPSALPIPGDIEKLRPIDDIFDFMNNGPYSMSKIFEILTNQPQLKTVVEDEPQIMQNESKNKLNNYYSDQFCQGEVQPERRSEEFEVVSSETQECRLTDQIGKYMKRLNIHRRYKKQRIREMKKQKRLRRLRRKASKIKKIKSKQEKLSINSTRSTVLGKNKKSKNNDNCFVKYALKMMKESTTDLTNLEKQLSKLAIQK